jgi:hypothetical protein
VKNGSDLQWFRLGPIDDQVRVDRKEFHIFVGQILSTVTGTRGSGKKNYCFADGGFNAVRNCEAGLFFDVTPDLDEIERSLRRLPRRWQSRSPEAVFGFWPQGPHRGFRYSRLKPAEGDRTFFSAYLRGR